MKDNSMTRFNGKVALITGAASGIGKATALQLGREGASLFLADIDTAGLAQTIAELDTNTIAHTATLDVTDGNACVAVVEKCVATLGGLDILCNIAGIAMCKHFADISDDEWQRIMNINVNSVFYLTRAAIPHLLESKGNIVNMASTAGLVGQAYNSAYCATKAAVVMLTKSLAIEYAKKGIRVNAICPGMVKTPLTGKLDIPVDIDQQLMEKLYPLIEGADPEEIATCIAYLASSEARFITGAALPIDGAQTAG